MTIVLIRFKQLGFVHEGKTLLWIRGISIAYIKKILGLNERLLEEQ